ncbi:MAG TPA: matrixin family metalloprotease [Fimbriimonadaceae bacterium]|nr:matrixin family metalloprotease [Fimbriimonadaceae bacterium]HRJ95818.1 matrixin family metalloprotease [Fimbriimonadaceae bacterium]
MKRLQPLFILGLVSCSVASQAWSTLGTKWGMGVHVATHLAGHEGTPGMATWSVMPGGLPITGYETHSGTLTGDFGMLLGTPMETEELAIITSVFDTWAAVCGLFVLGPVMDGMVPGGAPHAIGGGTGDIRIGVIGGFPSSSTLGHAYLPGTEFLYGPGGTLTGDVHLNIDKTWIDDPFDPTGDGDYDLHTVLLHEVGHALGLGHSDVEGSVMYPTYGGGNRTLSADDIEGIQFIYGVPEPTTMAAFGLGVLWIARRRRKKTA